MKSNLTGILKKKLKKLFFSVFWYEVTGKKRISIKKKNFRLVVVKSKRDVSKTFLKEYFKRHYHKLKRLNSKFYFLVLVKEKKFLSSGWIYFGSKWKITEVDKYINLNRKLLLFDFETPQKFRNRGYYQLLLKFIRNKFINKKLAIYSFSTNKKSKRAIYKAGFTFVKKIYGL